MRTLGRQHDFPAGEGEPREFGMRIAECGMDERCNDHTSSFKARGFNLNPKSLNRLVVMTVNGHHDA
jgi:hypothetical protein